MAYGEIPRGLEDLGGYVLSASDVPGTKVDGPGARGLNWTIESDSDQLEGDNSIIAVVRNPKRLTGSVEGRPEQPGVLRLPASAAPRRPRASPRMGS